MYVKVVEAAEEFVALQEAAALKIDWNSTAVNRAWLKLQQAVEEHKQEGGETIQHGNISTT